MIDGQNPYEVSNLNLNSPVINLEKEFVQNEPDINSHLMESL